MLKFYRRIRRKLLDEGSLRKYLMYSFGEILLVVIGILIALQINNWNEVRKAKTQERQYLQAVKEEFDENLNRLDRAINLNLRIIEAAKKLSEQTCQEEINISDEEHTNLIVNAFLAEPNYQAATGVLMEMISSGNLKIISNIELKRSLAAWESRLNRISNQEKEVYLYRKHYTDHLRKYGSYKRIFDESGLTRRFGLQMNTNNNSNLPLLQSEEAENDLLLFLATSYFLDKSFYQPLKNNIQKILELTEHDLDTKF